MTGRIRRRFVVKESSIIGRGLFATQRIRPGERIIEYIGERISHSEADERYNDEATDHPQVVLFSVDKRTVIDPAVGGNEAALVNHSCEPNCEARVERGRVFIEALRGISPGEELTCDYRLGRNGRHGSKWDARYACLCGAERCRGTLLEPSSQRSIVDRRRGRSALANQADAAVRLRRPLIGQR
jgi:SET domain-containing protein